LRGKVFGSQRSEDGTSWPKEKAREQGATKAKGKKGDHEITPLDGACSARQGRPHVMGGLGEGAKKEFEKCRTPKAVVVLGTRCAAGG